MLASFELCAERLNGQSGDAGDVYRTARPEIDREMGDGFAVRGFDDGEEIELAQCRVLREHFAAKCFDFIVDAEHPIGIGVQRLSAFRRQCAEENIRRQCATFRGGVGR